MKAAEGDVTISRRINGNEANDVVIKIELEGIRLAEITISLENFALAITGRSQVPGVVRTWLVATR